MTDETCCIIVRTRKKPETSGPEDDHRYRAFYVYGPDGRVFYSGGSYRSAHFDCENYPGFPIVEAYTFPAPITGTLDHHPYTRTPPEEVWEEMYAPT